MTESEHRTVFESLGAYALGAVPEPERRAIAAHLERCPICAEDAASLRRAATPPIDVVPAVEPTRGLRDRIMAVVEPEAELLRGRRRRRTGVPLRGVATAGVALVAGGVIGATALDGSGNGAQTRTLQAQAGRGHAWIELSGDRAHLVVDGMAAPARRKVYELWIQSGAARPRPASDDLSRAVFVLGAGRVEIPARVQPGDRVMVTAERAGGARVPTSDPVLVTARA